MILQMLKVSSNNVCVFYFLLRLRCIYRDYNKIVSQYDSYTLLRNKIISNCFMEFQKEEFAYLNDISLLLNSCFTYFYFFNKCDSINIIDLFDFLFDDFSHVSDILPR